jgi:hypothetical protein
MRLVLGSTSPKSASFLTRQGFSSHVPVHLINMVGKRELLTFVSFMHSGHYPQNRHSCRFSCWEESCQALERLVFSRHPNHGLWVWHKRVETIQMENTWVGRLGLPTRVNAIVAIVAGQLASSAAARSGPTGPFELSSGVLGVGFLLAALLLKANHSSSADTGDGPCIADAVKVICKDPKIILVGAV